MTSEEYEAQVARLAAGLDAARATNWELKKKIHVLEEEIKSLIEELSLARQPK